MQELQNNKNNNNRLGLDLLKPKEFSQPIIKPINIICLRHNKKRRIFMTFAESLGFCFYEEMKNKTKRFRHVPLKKQTPVCPLYC